MTALPPAACVTTQEEDSESCGRLPAKAPKSLLQLMLSEVQLTPSGLVLKATFAPATPLRLAERGKELKGEVRTREQREQNQSKGPRGGGVVPGLGSATLLL